MRLCSMRFQRMDTRMAQSFGIRSKRCSKTKPINCAEASVSDPVGWRDFLISPKNVAAGSENSPLQSAAIVSGARGSIRRHPGFSRCARTLRGKACAVTFLADLHRLFQKMGVHGFATDG